MIKNKTKAGMILIYTDEYGNQKAIEPKDLKVKLDSETEINLGNFIRDTCVNVDSLRAKQYKLEKTIKELTTAIELQHAQLVLDNQEIESLKKKIGGNK
jgi:uncharacterized protein involved in exopolysaccharide biosynthesis